MSQPNYSHDEVETQAKGELYSKEAEEALLGFVLINPQTYPTINIQDDFYFDRSRWIWNALGALMADDIGVDNITLADRLQIDGHLQDVGGVSYIGKLSGLETSYIGNPHDYEAIIKRHSVERKRLDLAGRVAKGEDVTADLKDLQTTPDNDFCTWADMDGILGPIAWDWKGWLPRGFLNISVGMSGEGKSMLALRICGCYLLGWDWPDGTPFTGQIGKVVWCEAEAAQAMNLERAKRWGLPIENILIPGHDPLSDFRLSNPKDKDSLATLAMRSDVTFVVVDSLSGADPTAEKSTEDAVNVSWLAALARDSQKPVQLTHHLRKKSIFDIESGVSLDRVRGISTIIQYARVIWALDVPDPGQPESKRLCAIKNNLNKKPEPLGVTIGENGLTFGAAPQAPRAETISDKATDLLMALLADEPQPAAVILDEFKNAGISPASMYRAKEKLRIVSIKVNERWKWSLPVK
jgi:hypothetical protein